jgi:6-phosphogluconolactonase
MESAIRIVAGAGSLARFAAVRFGALAREAVGRRGRFACAVPGGPAARLLLPAFAQAAADPATMRVFFTDERASAPDDPDSNHALARRLWFDPAGVPAGSVHRMRGEARDLERAAADYEADLQATLGDPPSLDLAVLGLGEDGHVAALYPGHFGLASETRGVIAVADAPEPPPRRLTLSLAALTASREVWLVALGPGTARAVRDALASRDGATGPAALVLQGPEQRLLLLDAAAAGALPGGG